MFPIVRRVAFVFAAALLFVVPSLSAKDKKDKDKPSMVLFWPNESNATLKVTFEKFNQLAVYEGQLSLESHALVENLSAKRIPQASFTVYLLDKDKVRIGNGMLSFSDLDPGQQAKLNFQVFAVGVPATLSLVARNDSEGIPTSLKTVPLKVISVPPGANLRVDGKDQGMTPITVHLTVGNHTLGFSKEGYASGSSPVDIKADEAAGGSITFELGGLSRDSVELRNGTVLQGDLVSVTMASVVMRVDGKEQTYDRNQVQKIILVEREPVTQPAASPPAAGPPK